MNNLDDDATFARFARRFGGGRRRNASGKELLAVRTTRRQWSKEC